MRLASSWMVIASGIDDLADQLSFGSFAACPFRRWVRRRNEAIERSRDVVGGEGGDQRQATALPSPVPRLVGGLGGDDGGRIRAAGAAADLARTFILVGTVGGNAWGARGAHRGSRTASGGGTGSRGDGLRQQPASPVAVLASASPNRFLASISALRLASSSRRCRSSSALRRASAASRSACSMPSRRRNGAWLLPRPAGALRLRGPWRRPARWRARNARLPLASAVPRRNRRAVRRALPQGVARGACGRRHWRRPARAHGFPGAGASPPTRRLPRFSTTTCLVRPWLKLWRTVPVLDARLERQGLGRDTQSLVARRFGINHSAVLISLRCAHSHSH